MHIYNTLLNAFKIHQRREVIILVILLPPLLLILIYQYFSDISRGNMIRENKQVQVIDISAKNTEGTQIPLMLDGSLKKLFFRCELKLGDTVTVIKDSYENGDIIYHATECRF